MYDWSSFFSQPTGQVILGVLLLGLPIIPNLWGIYHAFYRVFPTDSEKMIWVCLCIFLPVLGGVIYFFVGRKRGRKPDYSTPNEE